MNRRRSSQAMLQLPLLCISISISLCHSIRDGAAGGVWIPTVDAEEACALLSSSSTHCYLDVRTWEEFDKGHVAGARNVPYYLSETPYWKEKNPYFVEQVTALYAKDQNLIVGCRTGVRSKLATVDLIKAGFKNLRNLEGGYLSLLQTANCNGLVH